MCGKCWAMKAVDRFFRLKIELYARHIFNFGLS